MAANPAFLSLARVRTTRLVLMMLVVWGSTESRVDSRNVPPSTMAPSFAGPSLLRLSSFLINSDLAWVDLREQAVGVTEQLRQADRNVCVVQADAAAVVQIWPGIGFGLEVDVLLAGRVTTPTHARRCSPGSVPSTRCWRWH